MEPPEGLNPTNRAPEFSQCPKCQKQTFHKSNPWTFECSSCGKKLTDKETESRYMIPGVEGCKHVAYDYCRSLDKAHSPESGYTRKRKGDWLVQGVIQSLNELCKTDRPEILEVIELGEPRGEEHKHPDILVILKDRRPILIECKNIIPYYGYHSINANFRIKIEEENWNGGTYYYKHSSPGGRWTGLKPIPIEIVNPRRVLVITVMAFLSAQDENRLKRRFETVEIGHAYLPSPFEEPTFKDPQPECMENARRRLREHLNSLMQKS